MSLKKKPVTGMKDILPQEMEIRNYVMDLIKKRMLRMALFLWKPRVLSILRIFPASREEKMKSSFLKS